MRISHDDGPVVARVRDLVAPIASDLGLDLYDVEQRGGTLRVTLDTPPGSDERRRPRQLALATRLVSRELDHDDPVPGHYTLEVTSPGVERACARPPTSSASSARPSASASPTSATSSAGSRACSSPPTTPRRRSRSPIPTRRADRTRRRLRPDRPRQDRVRVGSQAEAGPVEGRPKRRDTTPTAGTSQKPARAERRSSRREQPRHERSDPPARPGEGSVGGRAAARARRRARVRLQAAARRGRRGRRRGQPADDGVHVHRLRPRRGRQLDQRARRHAQDGRARAASPPRRSAR